MTPNDESEMETIQTIRIMREAVVLSDRMVQESLRDSDIASKSEDYRQGYIHGFTEAKMAFLAWLRQQK